MAIKQVHAHLKSVGSSELQGWAFERLASDPVSPTDGQIWENTTDKVIKYYDGATALVLVDTTVVTSETVAGLIELATAAEVATGTDAVKAITPATLATALGGLVFPTVYGVALDSAETDVTRVFAGGQTVYTVVHAQGFTNFQSEVKEVSTGDKVIVDISTTDTNTLTVAFNGNSTDNTFNLVLIGS
jgi:hypothetical protein